MKGNPAELPEALTLYEFVYEDEATRRVNALFKPTPFVPIESAWAVMLARQGVLDEKHIPTIMRRALELWESDDPPFGGFGCLEKYVIQKDGVEVGGSLTIGRTIPPLRQLAPARQQLLKLLPMLYELQQVMLDTAEQYADAVMPGYTHVRQAQPETFGHYLLSVYDPMDRIMRQIETGYRLLSLNELGCGALAGTSVPIDRDMTTELLGLEGLVENSNDAVAFTDGYVTLVAALANLMSVWSRFTLDVQYWSGEEYGFLHVPWLSAKHAPQSEGGKGKSHSHFMPNKLENSPYIERTRVGAAELQGHLTEIVAMSCRAPHGDTHEMLHMIDASARAMRSTFLYLHVWIHALPRLTLDRQRMLDAVRNGYSCASELSNQIMMTQNLNGRTAHEITNEFIARCRQQNINAPDVPLSLLQDSAREVIGRELDFSEKQLRDALDPEKFIETTNSRGGTSPSECRRMIAQRREQLDEAEQSYQKTLDKLETARQRLFDAVKSLAEASASV